MNKIYLALFIVLFCTAFARAQNSNFAFGADLSYVKQVEEKGLVFKDNHQLKPALEIFSKHGYNWVRLRTCVEPATLPNTLAYTIAMAKQAKKLGFKLLLDLHYSNAWADPTNEPTPAAWRSLDHKGIVNALYNYTRNTIAAMRDSAVLPDMVQIGNEVGNGMLWPSGKLPENWDNFADYLYAGINGLDAGRGNFKRPQVMIHVDHGGDIAKTKAFFDKLKAYQIPFDVIGFSFYPWSHGTLIDLKENLTFTAREYGKDVYVVETGYYWKPSKYFLTLPGPFPETPEGQKLWLEEVAAVVMAVPDNKGKGVMWWEPAANGGLRAVGFLMITVTRYLL